MQMGASSSEVEWRFCQRDHTEIFASR